MFSQHNEEQYITEYFRGYTGLLLSIGENDGVTYSNVRQLILNGWSAVLVEPAPLVFDRLSQLYIDRPDVILVNKAIAPVGGRLRLYDSGEHVIRGSRSLLSTTIPKEMNRWPGVPFEEIEVLSITVTELMKYIDQDMPVDFISIDAEGMDLFILKNLPLDKLGTRLVCVEWNNRDFDAYNDIMKQFDAKLIYENYENLIYAI